MLTKIGRFDILIIVSYRHLKNSKCSEKLFLNSLVCLKTDPPPQGLRGHKSPTWEFHQPGKIDSYHRRGD